MYVEENPKLDKYKNTGAGDGIGVEGVEISGVGVKEESFPLTPQYWCFTLHFCS